MAQTTTRKELKNIYVDIEEIIVEILPEKEKTAQIIKIKKRPLKNRLSKLFKKAELNAKYFEEIIPIEKVKSKVYSRLYGIRIFA